IELCLDKAQHALNAELVTLKSTLLTLEHQLDNAREGRKRLDQERRRFGGKQEVYAHNLKIDYEILRMVRTTYPQEIQLSGFLLTEKKLHD
uniref:Uncharacterized protein n=1 Tax=Plectus sambesii TaxID=2011161 RepID=A0A914VCF4_9BILA